MTRRSPFLLWSLALAAAGRRSVLALHPPPCLVVSGGQVRGNLTSCRPLSASPAPETERTRRSPQRVHPYAHGESASLWELTGEEPAATGNSSAQGLTSDGGLSAGSTSGLGPESGVSTSGLGPESNASRNGPYSQNFSGVDHGVPSFPSDRPNDPRASVPGLFPQSQSTTPFFSGEYEEAYLIGDLMSRFKGRVIHCCSPAAPFCDVFLCGTLHVARSSTEMVRETVRLVSPDFVVVEVCEARIDNLCEVEEHLNVSLAEVLGSAWSQRSFKQLGMGFLSWMQNKAAKGLNSQLGGELAAATKEGVSHGATIVLGDRLYAVTIQRVFDRLGLLEKLKMACIMLWEALTMSLGRLREYVKRSETEEDFVKREIEKFGRYLPSVAEVIIHERDEYLAQTVIETARVGIRAPKFGPHRRGRIVVVIGAGHLQGVQNHLATGGVSAQRISEISSSSKHPPTWPGTGMLSVVNGTALYPQSR